MDTCKLDYDVAIVGYGPIGKVLSILLGQQGWKVGVFERWPEPFPLPRAIVFDDEVARILQSVCDMDEVAKICEPIEDDYEWRNASGQTLLTVPFPLVGLSGWPGSNFFNQPGLEQVLAVSCESQTTVQVHMGHEVTKLTEYDKHVELVIKDQKDVQKRVSARYVVGCDGANSLVRQQMNVPVTDLGFTFEWLVVDVIPHEKRVWKPKNWQLCDPQRPTTVVSSGPGRRRWEFMKLPGESLEELNTEKTAWKLLEPWGLTPENATLERHAGYTFRASWAEAWRKGRLLLAGDAAHLTPPFLGQGMCAGIRDAKNLAWKLNLVLQGKVEKKLLDTYTLERKTHVQEIIKMAVSLGEIICVTDPKEAEKRDEAFLSGKVPPMPPFPILTGGVLHRGPDGAYVNPTGQPSLQAKVKHQDQFGLFDDVVGQGWTVISPVDDPRQLLGEEQIAFLKELGANFVHISNEKSSSSAVLDAEGKYADYFKELGLEAMVIRPDYYVFGGTQSVDDLHLLIQGLSEQLFIRNSESNLKFKAGGLSWKN